MPPDPTEILSRHEGELTASIREAVATVSKHAETIGLAGQQLQQVVMEVSANSSERDLRAAAVTIRAITVQLALVALDVSAAVGELEAVAGIRAAAELNRSVE